MSGFLSASHLPSLPPCLSFLVLWRKKMVVEFDVLEVTERVKFFLLPLLVNKEADFA
jgi:hypothetical protein